MPSARTASRLLALHRDAVRVRDGLFSRAVAASFGSFGAGSVLALPVRLIGPERIHVGAGVYVGSASWLRVGGEDPDARLELGDGCRISGHAVLSAVRSVRLGRSVLVARGVHVTDHDHRHDRPGVPVLDQGVARVGPVWIGDGAWLGSHVVVGPGVTIGAGAVIGAGSVVRDDVPAGAVAVGAPARVVRTREAVSV